MAKQNTILLWQGVTKDLCGEPRVACLVSYEQHRPQIEKLTRDNQVRLSRYHSLYHYKSFGETMPNRIITKPLN
jgi:hypothetical protein